MNGSLPKPYVFPRDNRWGGQSVEDVFKEAVIMKEQYKGSSCGWLFNTHRWSELSDSYDTGGSYYGQYRFCRKCGKLKLKLWEYNLGF